MSLKVEKYDEGRGICTLYDTDTGRRFSARCEPTGTIKQYKSENKIGGTEMQNYTNASDATHAAVLAYQQKHGEKDYGVALRGVLKEAEESEAQAHKDVATWTRNYQREFGIDDPEKARARLFADAPNIAEGVGAKKQPLNAGEVVDARAKSYAHEHRVSYAEALSDVLYQDDHLRYCYENNRPYLEGGVKKYQELESGPAAVQRLGALLSGAKSDNGLLDIEFALRVANLAPDLVRAAADERLVALANQFIINEGMPGFHTDNFPVALRRVRQDHPELVASSESGGLSETALKEILFSWNWPSA